MEEKDSKQIRAFIAIEIPKEVREKLHSIQQELMHKNVSMVSQDKMHVTLFFLGNVDLMQLEEIKKLLQEVSFSSFKISINGIGSFNGRNPRVIFAKIEEGKEKIIGICDSLHDLINKITRIEDRQYTPHVTIARPANIGRSESISIISFIESNSNLPIGEFICGSIKIIESRATGSGYKYFEIYDKELDSIP